MTRIIIEFNQVGEWHLLAGQTIIRNFPNGCGTFTQRVQSFFHEFGEATALYAESLGETKAHLVTVTRLTLAQDLRLTINPGSKTYSGSFKLGNSHTQLGISCRNFVKDDETKPGISFLELRSGSARLETVPLGPVIDLEIEPLEVANLIRFLVDQRTMTAGGYEIEFVCRKQPADEWTTLRVAEPQGICGTRMLLVPDPFAPAPESLWEDVLSTTWRSFDQGDVAPDALRFPIEKKDLEICFARFQHIFDYHYSSAGWGAARWLRVAFGRLCKEAAAAAPSDLARIAVIGLCEKATDTAALYRPLIFGDQPDLWTLTPEGFESDLYPADSVGECFGALGTLGKCEGLNEFLAQRQNVDVFVFGSFRRAPGGHHTYDFGHFSRELVKALADFELDRAVRPPLLSVGHFAQALDNLRRNIGALLRERDPEDSNRPARHGAISSILGFHRRLPAVEGSVRDKLHVQNCELDIDVYTPLPGPEIRRLVFTLTALARLRSFGKVNADEYRRLLGRVFNAPEGDPRNIQKGATLLLDLAPELFACALLFWEVVLFEQQ